MVAQIVACRNCGKERQIYPYRIKGQGYTGLCLECLTVSRRAGKSPWYKAGKCFRINGYILARVYPEDEFYPMANSKGYVYEHRLVMARHLDRLLKRWEIVHHKGVKYPKGSRENRADNRIENLELITGERHKQITILENRIQQLEKELVVIAQQERERILKLLDDMFEQRAFAEYHKLFESFRQALKEGK